MRSVHRWPRTCTIEVTQEIIQARAAPKLVTFSEGIVSMRIWKDDFFFPANTWQDDGSLSHNVVWIAASNAAHVSGFQRDRFTRIFSWNRACVHKAWHGHKTSGDSIRPIADNSLHRSSKSSRETRKIGGENRIKKILLSIARAPLLEFRFVVISKITDQKFRNSWRKKIFISFSRRQIPISELERTLSPFYNLLRLTQNFLPFRFPRQRFRFTIYILYLKIIPSPPRNTQKFDREKKVSIHTSAIIENEGGSMEGLRDLPSIPVLWGGRFTSYAGSRGGSFLELSRPSPILTGMISVFERSWNLYLSAEHHPEIVLVLLSRVGRNRGERAMEIFPWPLASTDVQHS